ncbi:MAG: serine/threonine-protein kinase [Polyangiaceae bacterium]|nr:serine/threonine-protein kinase [Polyangiaceae bacterium]
MGSVLQSKSSNGDSAVRQAAAHPELIDASADTFVEQPYGPGEVIADKYVLVRPLEQGGMGTVWVAHNRVLDVQVGIKLINIGQAHLKEMADRLLSEARSAARLDHAAIVRVTDFGRTRLGDPFLAMELLSGENLAELLMREGRLAPKQAIQLLLPIAHALATAHENGIIHRDVKPENVYLAKDKEVGIQPKLLDFGIARMTDSPTRVTLAGSLLGTPDYMSPEQARGEAVDAASDSWSFSVMVYEAISGQVPFVGENYLSLLRSIIEDSVPSLGEQGLVDARLWQILAKGLKKDKKDRWPTLRSFGEALALWLLDQGSAEDITGTSIYRSWLRDPESNSWSDISQLTNGAELRALVVAQAQVKDQVRAPEPEPSSVNRESLLQALAQMSAAGDPVELLLRAERRRVVSFAMLFVCVVAAACVGLLASLDLLVV